jgi:guanylate cyclase
MLETLVSIVASIGADPRDNEDTRLRKTLLVFSSVMMASLAIVWSAVYFAYRETLAASIPFIYAFLSFLSVGWFAWTRHYGFFRASQLLFPLLLPFFLMLALGGFVSSSAVILWSITSPFGALLFAGRRQALGWFLAYLALIVIGALLEPFGHPASNLPPAMLTAFFVMNIGGVSIVTVVLLQYFMNQKDTTLSLLHLEQDKSERLLLNVLPREIAARLKNEHRVIADRLDSVSILFADVVNFTSLSARLTPEELVGLLNEVFSHFDTLVERYRLEKIKTIGDCYMVAAGVPRPRPDHAQALTRLALDIRDYVRQREFKGQRLDFRIGLNSGSVVAGVIGRNRFIYDLWGDAVNTASRMESHGVGGVVQITEATYELIKHDFVCEPHGVVKVKGKGEMNVWYVLERRPPTPSEPHTSSSA